MKIWQWDEAAWRKIREDARTKLWPVFAKRSPTSGKIVDLIVKWAQDHGKL
jgi:hypothetical protein